MIHIPNYLFVRESKGESFDQSHKRHFYSIRHSERTEMKERNTD